MTMSATQRLHTALSGGKPDRVPTLPKIWVDLAAVLTGTSLRDVIEDPATAMRVVVEAAMGVDADAARLFMFPKRSTRVVDDVLVEVDDSGDVLGPIDLQGGLATLLSDPERLRLDDPYRIAFLTNWSTHQPFVESMADVDRIAVPEKSFYEAHGLGELQRSMIALAGDRLAPTGNCGSATLAFTVLLRQMNNALLDLLEQPELVHAMMEKGAAIAIEKGKFHIDCGLTMLRLNDSVANMSVISPKMWRTFIFPHMKTVCTELHRYNANVRIYCHICGNVLPIMEDLMETGLDCIGPLDPLGGFSCSDARAAVGDSIALMGGVNTLSFAKSTPEELREEAKRCIDAAGANGGFVLGSGCALPRTSRRENLLALSRAAREYGKYASNSGWE